MTQKRRVAWLAATRSEVLQLGPLYKSLFQSRSEKEAGNLHRFVLTGEQGMAAQQAVDFLAIQPHEEFELRPPADDSAIRLHNIINSVEKYVRQERMNHLIFSGFSATAAAAAMVCHARSCRGLWVRPYDPIELNASMHWEGGLEKLIRSLDQAVTVLPVDTSLVEWVNSFYTQTKGQSAFSGLKITDRRADAPLILIAVSRRLWGMQGVLSRLAAVAAGWARAKPQADLLVLSALDQRLDAPLATMENRPGNLLSAPPLPFNEYATLLPQCAACITDSPHTAADAIALGIPLIALGEKWHGHPAHAHGQDARATENVMPITAEELGSQQVQGYLEKSIQFKTTDRATRFTSSKSIMPGDIIDWVMANQGR